MLGCHHNLLLPKFLNPIIPKLYLDFYLELEKFESEKIKKVEKANSPMLDWAICIFKQFVFVSDLQSTQQLLRALPKPILFLSFGSVFFCGTQVLKQRLKTHQIPTPPPHLPLPPTPRNI